MSNLFRKNSISFLAGQVSFSLDDNGAIVMWGSTEVTQPTEDEITAKIAELEAAEPMRLLRVERNRRLASTDWWASSDLTMTQEQIAYRQALRDITENYTSLDDVVWPVEPSGI